MKKITRIIGMLGLAVLLTACEGHVEAPMRAEASVRHVTAEVVTSPAMETEKPAEAVTETAEVVVETSAETEAETKMKMNVQVGDHTFTATLEENEAVASLVQMMQEAPVVIRMSDYAGFEKVGSLGTSLPTSNRQTTTQSGDIVLYNGNQIVIFYGSNSWSYTRLGKIDDLSGWSEALGSGDITVTFSVE